MEFAPETAPRRSGKLTAGGVLCIVSGGIGLIAGIILAAAGDTELGTEFSGILGETMTWAVITIILGIIAIAGGVYALKRESFFWAVLGGICALLSFWWLGIPSLVLIALSRKEFH